MPELSAEEMRARVGQEVVGEWVDVTQDMIDRFADATDDHQFIHVDPERAAQTPFGGTIAHGFLTLSLLTTLAARVPDASRLAGVRMGINYGLDRVRFISPVRSGSRVRGRSRLAAFEEKGVGRFRQVSDFTVEVEGQDKPALSAEWIVMLVAG